MTNLSLPSFVVAMKVKIPFVRQNVAVCTQGSTVQGKYTKGDEYSVEFDYFACLTYMNSTLIALKCRMKPEELHKPSSAMAAAQLSRNSTSLITKFQLLHMCWQLTT